MLLELSKIGELVNCLDFEWQLAVCRVHLYISVHGCLLFMKIKDFCYCIFCSKSSIIRNYCLENMRQGETRTLFTCTKLSSICARVPIMDDQFRRSEVWLLLGSQNDSLAPHSQIKHLTSLPKTCLAGLVWERKTVCFLSKFSAWIEWPLYSETENSRNIYGTLCVPRRRPISHKSSVVLKLWFCG